MLKNNSLSEESGSVSSSKANLTHLDENFKLEKNFINSKKITINRYLLNKLLTFFHNLIENLDTTNENKKTMFQLIDLVKTEESNFSFNNVDSENEKFLEIKSELEKVKMENENFKKNQQLLNSFNAELTEEINCLKSNLSESKNSILKLNEDLEALKNQREKIASDLLDAESLNKKLKKENMLLKNSSNLFSDGDKEGRIAQYEQEEAESHGGLDKDRVGNSVNLGERKENLEFNQIEKDKRERNDEYEDSNENNGLNSEIDNDKLRKLAHLFIQTPKLVNITSYFLSPKDYFNLKASSSNVNKTLTRNYNTLINQFKSVIVEKNKEIKSKNSDPLYGNLLNSDNQIVENLLKDYLQSIKIPGVNLKNNLAEDLKFLENEVIKPLGINMPKSEGNRGSIFGSLNNALTKMMKKDENTAGDGSRKSLISVTTGEDSALNDSEILLALENNKNYPLYLQFDYSNSDEIKGLLTSYLLGKFSSANISNFISKVLSNFSDLMFIAYNTLNEIKELDIVKNALHNKLKKLRKLNTDLEAEIDDLKRFSETNKTIKDILIKQKNDVEIRYNDCVSQIINYKEELNNVTNKFLGLTDKYNKIENEYESFKNKLIKEFKILKTQYERACDERDIVKEALFEFKQYFTRFNITDDGDIIYIEA